jgi:hypothetical protein
MLPGNEFRSDLPKLAKEGPVGYRPGLQLWERLQGLGAVLLGVGGLVVAYLIFTGVLPVGLPPPPPPPGVLVQVPLMNPAQCVVPLMAVGSISLVIVGFRRVIDP